MKKYNIIEVCLMFVISLVMLLFPLFKSEYVLYFFIQNFVINFYIILPLIHMVFGTIKEYKFMEYDFNKKVLNICFLLVFYGGMLILTENRFDLKTEINKYLYIVIPIVLLGFILVYIFGGILANKKGKNIPKITRNK